MHFHTLYPEECAALQQSAVWQYEGTPFAWKLPVGPSDQRQCPEDSALYRLYDQEQGGVPNHRYTDDLAVIDQMIAQGWIFEGEAETKVFACIPRVQ